MPDHAKSRRTLLMLCSLGCVAISAMAQAPAKPSPMVPAPVSTLPATTPTGQTAPIAATPLVAMARKHPQRATVTYAAGLLNVRANDSSLNSILRDISKLTGMTITGGVSDQRVFGNYGPGEPSVVLATLLDGTGTNLFLKEAADSSPAELTLTPRNGGPTPPSPSSSQYADMDDASGGGTDGNDVAPAAAFRRGGVTYPPGQRPSGASPDSSMSPLPSAFRNSGVLGDPNAVSPSASTLPVTNSIPVDNLPVPSTAQSPDGIVSAPSGPPQGSTTSGFTAAAQASATSAVTPTNDADTTGSTLPGGSTNSGVSGAAPNGVKTPEQIFEQLQQLRRAAQAQSGTGTTSTPGATTPPGSTTPQ